MKEINEVQVLLDAGATIATEEDLSRVTATDRKVLPFQSYTTKADWLRSEIEKLEMMKDDYPVDAQPTTKEHEIRINWANPVVHHALTSIITRYKEELKVLESKQ